MKFVDLDFSHVGWNQAAVSTLGCMLFTLLGAFGQTAQIRKIWTSKKAEQVSAIMSIVMCSLFATYLIRGAFEWRAMFLLQGFVRVSLFIPIIVGIYRFGEFTRKDRITLITSLALLGAMCVTGELRSFGFILIIYVGVAGNAHQAWQIRHKTGQVSFLFYLTMFLSVVFQAWYSVYFKEWGLLGACILFILIYGAIVVLIVKNKFQRKAAVT
jgi:hypothetical protein